MDNHGNFVGSLGNVCRYLGQKAEALGVEIYPGFPAAEVLIGDKGEVVGVATGDMGVAKNGEPKAEFTRGMELRAKYTILAEGARGSLTKQTIERYALNKDSDHQKYGLGVKELWQVRPEVFRPGLVQHSMGWPLAQQGRRRLVALPLRRPSRVGRLRGPPQLREPDAVALRGVPALQDAPDDPGRVRGRQAHRLRRARHHGGRLAVGAAAVVSRRLPCRRLGGFVNVPRIKGSHNAILSGMLCAEHVFDALQAGRANDEVSSYEEAWRSSPIGYDLKRVRNVKPLWSKYGTLVGIGLGGFDMWVNELTGYSLFGTLKHGKPDYATLKPLDQVKPIVYPKPDGVLTFDRLSSVFLSNTNHEEDQPSHLQVKDMGLQKRSEHDALRRPLAALLPGGGVRVGRGRGRGALPDQRPELRPLQDVRHQGPEPEHQLGHARGRRRAELH